MFRTSFFVACLVFSSVAIAQDGSSSAELELQSLLGLHPDYVAAFAKVQDPLLAGNYDEASQALVSMTDYRRDHGYPDAEEVHYQLLVLWLAEERGDVSGARSALELIVANGEGRLDDAVYVTAAIDLLRQQVEEKAYAESLATYESMMKADDGREAGESVSEVMAKVRAVVDGDEPFRITGELDADGKFSRQMIRRGMFIDAPDGGIAKQFFDCDNKQVTVPWQPGSELAIPESWGSCRLTIEGDAGAAFEWVQASVP